MIKKEAGLHWACGSAIMDRKMSEWGTNMGRIRGLNRYQKGVLLFTAVMVLAFTVAYAVTTSRVGFAYKDVLLLPEEENGTTVYSGKIHGVPASFRVSSDKEVEFWYGETCYGPYTAKEDPTALPEKTTPGERVTGVELRCGEEILFRGGVAWENGFLWLYNTDGSLSDLTIGVHAVSEYGITYDENGKVIDPMEPSVPTILRLMAGPELTHKGEWGVWLAGVFVCVVTVVSVLFARELFWLRISFRVQNPDQAEPSDMEVMGRYISWTVLPILALVLFLMGLQA